MELTFNKVGKQYEAEFELTANANLHIEFENATPVKLYQRTTGGGWDLVNDVKNAVGKATDVDLQALIYPKFIKVVCPSNPSYCAVTSNGEIIEIKSQAKSIEIISNGTTSIMPDAGFSYLSKVDVKTNVPQSSGTSAPDYIGFRIFAPGFGDGYEYEFSVYNETDTWQDAVNELRNHLMYQFDEQDGNVYVIHGSDSYMIYKTVEDLGWNSSYSDPVKVTDKLESRIYYIDQNSAGE